MQNYVKAIAGGLAAAIVAFLGCQDGGVTGQEWLTIVLAALGGSGLVYVAPKNKPKGEAGQVNLTAELVLLFILTLVVVLWWFGVRP